MTEVAAGWPRRLLRRAQAVAPRRPGGLRVLAYHLIGAGTGSAVDLPTAAFERHLDELLEAGRPVALEAAVRELAGTGPDDEPANGDDRRPRVAVTFDDAYDNFRTHAWPLLAERRIPVTLFVPVGFLEGETPAPIRGTGEPPISWPALAELAASELLTIGSHTWSHPDLPKLPAARVRDELRRSRQALEDRLAAPVRSFCYPRGLWSRRVEREVAEVYELATVGGGRRVTAETVRPLRIPRTSLRADGPGSLSPLLSAPVWIEEWVADRARRWRG